MSRVVGKAENDNFIIECTGQTTTVFDKKRNVLAKFKNMIYAYMPLIAPNNTLWVKANTGHISIYDLNSLTVIKKFKSTKAADHNLLISHDGKYVIELTLNIEGNLKTLIRFYEIDTYKITKEIVLERISSYMISNLNNECYYLINCENINDKTIYYLSKFDGEKIIEEKIISEVDNLKIDVFAEYLCYGKVSHRWNPLTSLMCDMDIDEVFEKGFVVDSITLEDYYDMLRNLVKDELEKRI